MKVIAHRGASGEYPENSLIAFQQAISQGCHGIELDVQWHPEGELFLLHDRYLNKLTNSHGKLTDYSLQQLANIKIKDQPLAILSQALATINGQCPINIEVKSSVSSPKELSAIVNALDKTLTQAINNGFCCYSDIIISSFNHQLLACCQQLLPQVKRAALLACSPLSIASLIDSLEVVSINPSIDCLTASLVNDIHALGKAVWVYTVDHEEDIAQCLSLGVDAVFSNYPARTIQTINYLSTK